MKCKKVYVVFLCSAFILMSFGVSSIEVESNEVEESEELNEDFDDDRIQLSRLLKHKEKKDEGHKGKKKCRKGKNEKDEKGGKKKRNCKKDEDKQKEMNMDATNATEVTESYYYYYVYYDDDAEYYYYDDDADNNDDDDDDASTSAVQRTYSKTNYNGDDDGSTIAYGAAGYYGYYGGNDETSFAEASGTATSAWRNIFFIVGFIVAGALLISPMRRGGNENRDSNLDSKIAIDSGMAEKSTNYHQMEDKSTNAGEIA